MKQYNGEKAIISLTSWKARINTVSKTIYSLIQQCPGFHIVLCLSEEEFPQKEAELPENLMLFVDNNLIEILWVYKNYKSFKKVLFTMDKYRDVPVISADDDCIYTCNYAQELYDKWTENKDCIVSYKNGIRDNIKLTWGCATLYPNYYLSNYGLEYLTNEILKIGLDDNYIFILRQKLNLIKTSIIVKKIEDILYFHDEKKALHDNYRLNNYHDNAYIKIKEILHLKSL